MGELGIQSRTIAPKLGQYGTTKPGPLLDLAPGGIYLEGNDWEQRWARKRIKGFYVMGDYMQAADTINIYVQMDDNAPKLAASRAAPEPGSYRAYMSPTLGYPIPAGPLLHTDQPVLPRLGYR